MEKKTFREHFGLALSTGLGVLSGEFFGEYGAKVSGYTGWNRTGLKGIIKAVWGAFWLFLAGKVTDPKIAKYMEMAAYGSMGSIIMDIIAALYPGGIPGLATMLALRGKAVQAALPTVQRAIAPTISATTPMIRLQAVPSVTPTPSAATKGALY